MSIRIQFDVNLEEWERLSRYISNKKIRHVVGKDALMEWCSRREGRDKKLRDEKLKKQIEDFTPIVLEILKKEGIL